MYSYISYFKINWRANKLFNLLNGQLSKTWSVRTTFKAPPGTAQKRFILLVTGTTDCLRWPGGVRHETIERSKIFIENRRRHLHRRRHSRKGQNRLHLPGTTLCPWRSRRPRSTSGPSLNPCRAAWKRRSLFSWPVSWRNQDPSNLIEKVWRKLHFLRAVTDTKTSQAILATTWKRSILPGLKLIFVISELLFLRSPNDPST